MNQSCWHKQPGKLQPKSQIATDTHLSTEQCAERIELKGKCPTGDVSAAKPHSQVGKLGCSLIRSPTLRRKRDVPASSARTRNYEIDRRPQRSAALGPVGVSHDMKEARELTLHQPWRVVNPQRGDSGAVSDLSGMHHASVGKLAAKQFADCHRAVVDRRRDARAEIRWSEGSDATGRLVQRSEQRGADGVDRQLDAAIDLAPIPSPQIGAAG